ncbi:MAG: MltA domain-containing protein, partial [Methylophilaceae bacterium]
MKKILFLALYILLTAACTKHHTKPNAQNCNCSPSTQAQAGGLAPIQLPENTRIVIVRPSETNTSVAVKGVEYSFLKPAKWHEVEGLLEDNLAATWPAWLQSCSTLIKKSAWQAACAAANTLATPDNVAVNTYLTTYFDVYSANSEEGTNAGLVTGYYQPTLKGSRKKSAQYPYPLYRQPNDLVTVDLSEIYPELKFKRVRGKLLGNKLVPYSTRAEIEANPSPLAGNEIVWINDIIDVFFLHIQGSGLVQL